MNIFILLIGFPGVGKLAIAKELSPLFSAKIVDNHWFNNPILRLIDDDGTSPLPNGIWEYTGRVRQAVLDAIVAYGAPSANFIFTHAGIEGDERSMRTFQQIAAAAQQRQALLVPIRLLCDEDELARRISTPARRVHLKSIDVEASRERSRRACVLDPQHQNTLVLDVTFASPGESADAIRNHVLNAASSRNVATISAAGDGMEQ
ncbi:chloramphenicol phosphotransferase [Rhizobium sp. NZLR1]|uniref:chloramphenicol phosphotransferase n=1 Tax=Rhizobium sp. NZLR1 TaxID=2731096 RepID=UPI001A992854|nr:chloramphenicol phosphotransferase [Rhizobium sp. NZLR1]MBX5203076.1 chloramphenicol phosphotransferase [Rhizobium sp. NZLR1]QSZ19457.1 chloramphenicol phosphotransferase [Rhizobium sp. NZLR1]